MNINWDNFKCRCSSLGCLFTEPQSKADKDAGLLSKTAKSHLISVYLREAWGIDQDITTKYMEKGIVCEGDAIELLSRVDQFAYIKNDDRKENNYLTGHPDIVLYDEIIDVKVSWNAQTFLPKLFEPIDKDYFYQLQGYMWLFGVNKARLSYCLVNTPESIINGEKYRLFKAMNCVTEESPEYLRAARHLELSMTFDRFPIKQRLISLEVSRNEEIIEKIPDKVKRAREFLAEIYNKHHVVSDKLESTAY